MNTFFFVSKTDVITATRPAIHLRLSSVAFILYIVFQTLLLLYLSHHAVLSSQTWTPKWVFFNQVIIDDRSQYTSNTPSFILSTPCPVHVYFHFESILEKLTTVFLHPIKLINTCVKILPAGSQSFHSKKKKKLDSLITNFFNFLYVFYKRHNIYR